MTILESDVGSLLTKEMSSRQTAKGNMGLQAVSLHDIWQTGGKQHLRTVQLRFANNSCEETQELSLLAIRNQN